MQFNYGDEGSGWQRTMEHERYRYVSEYSRPKFEIVKEPARPTQPFEKQDSLVERIFADTPAPNADPLLFPAQRADLHHRQMDLQLELLGARHAINYEIRKQIEYEECKVRARLHEIHDRPVEFGREGKFETGLLKQLQQLRKERQAESVACWRDTSRLVSDLSERWTEYADESRKARWLEDGL